MVQSSDTSRPTGNSSSVATISSGIMIQGNVECEGELLISGTVTGEVRCTTIVIDEHGTVDGSIEAERLRVSGSAHGAISVSDLAIEVGGRVGGETTYARLKIVSGGIIEGTFIHRPNETSGSAEAPFKLVTVPDANPRRVFVD